jgi:hypothetical protein
MIYFIAKGRAGRTGQSQTGECYLVAHERDMKQVNFNSLQLITSFFALASRDVIYRR